MQEVSNEVVTPQTHYWFSRKDHIRNRRGKKKSQGSCLQKQEFWIMSCLVPGKAPKSFFFWTWPKRSIFKWKSIQGIYVLSYVVWYFPDNVNGQMLMEVSELEPRKGEHDTKRVKLPCPSYGHRQAPVAIGNLRKENAPKWEGSWNRKIYSFSFGDFTTSASNCGGSSLASS